MKMSLKAKEEGLSIRPVVAKANRIIIRTKGSQNPFSGTDTFKKLKNLSHDERVSELSKDHIKNKYFLKID